MKRIVLFRFHKDLNICINRLKLLHRFNPGIQIIGLWGGEASGFQEAQATLAPYLDHVWDIPVASPEWKWKNGDLSLMMWYRQLGKDLSFDMLHLLEWDLLVLDSLDNVYGAAGRKGVALTALTPLERIQDHWNWTAHEPLRSEWHQLQQHVKDLHGWQGPYFACQGPANAFSKAFLDRYAQEDIPELMHEELRLPLFAQAYGFELTGLPHIYREIQHKKDMRYFNCEKILIKKKVIRWELLKPSGRKVFHPYQKLLPTKGPLWFF